MFKRVGDLLLGVLFGLLCAGLILLVCRPDPGKAVLLRPPPSPAPIKVDVEGAVHSPGVYALPPDSRVEDAVAAAGGCRPDAYRGALNLAEFLVDGSRIYVPIRRPTAPADELGSITEEAVYQLADGRQLIDINLASQAALETLPGIGPVTAQAILEYRQENPFAVIEEIQQVPGIGAATYEQIRRYITVGE